MYDEFEQAVTGKPKKGIPVFGWILIAMALIFMFGVVGVGFAAHKVKGFVEGEFSEEFAAELAEELAEVEIELAEEMAELEAELAEELGPELAARLADQLGGHPAEFTSDLFSRLRPRLQELAADPNVGLALKKKMGSSDGPRRALKDILEGSLRIHTEDGDVTAELRGSENGGSLVIDSPDGEVRIDLTRMDHGGELTIQTEERTLHFGAGSAAAGLPLWVPELDGMPSDPEHLFSANSDEGALGAVSWAMDRSPEAVLDSYRKELEDAGYELREEHATFGHGDVDGGFWAENEKEDRVVFMAVSEEHGMTKIILGYGEEIH